MDVSSDSSRLIDQALAILEREVRFTCFFETEKLGILHPDEPEYVKARNAYLLDCHTTGKKQQAHGKKLRN